MKKELIGLSRFLSLVLRHDPAIIGIKLDKNGWVSCDELISKVNKYKNEKKSIELTKEILDEVVDTNDKKRFAYSQDKIKIRASQGHSIDVDLKLKPVEPPEYLYHGTAYRFIKSIKEDGLNKMSRQHVHMNEIPSMSEKVGSRHGTAKVLRIRANEMYKNGVNFYLSENKVWLTDNIDTKYIDFDWN